MVWGLRARVSNKVSRCLDSKLWPTDATSVFKSYDQFDVGVSVFPTRTCVARYLDSRDAGSEHPINQADYAKP